MSIRLTLATAAVGALVGATQATAAATPEEVATAPVASTGSADLLTGSAGPGSILCWLLHPSPTCQI
ncbi:hypothetical protein [Nocardia pseudobrasiliensis]|nr:hypothetical protein [Nocardia pseudobrasiliensis]